MFGVDDLSAAALILPAGRAMIALHSLVNYAITVLLKQARHHDSTCSDTMTNSGCRHALCLFGVLCLDTALVSHVLRALAFDSRGRRSMYRNLI